MIASARANLAALLCMLAVFVPAQVSAKNDQPLSYRVQSGDTLNSLASRYFTSKAAVAPIAKFNKISDPDVISVGKVLRIPRRFLKHSPVVLKVFKFSGSPKISGMRPVVGRALQEEDRVNTGVNGFITFQGTRGAIVSLPSNTSATLKRARIYKLGNLLDVDFYISKGRSEVTAPKLRNQENFRIRTPLAVTAVRGTEFRVGHDEETGLSVAEVTEGAVAVEAGAEADLAKSGFGVPLTASGVGDIEALLPAAKIANQSEIHTKEAIKFSIIPVEGAEFYRTQIAADGGFLEVIGEDFGAGTEANFAGLPNGTYFVRARGVSAAGVEGYSADALAFKRKRLGVSAEAEPSLLEDGFKFLWIADGAENGSFAFQLWDTNSPGQPIVDEVGVQDGGFIVTGLEPGTYMWRVAAAKVDSDGLLKVWSPAKKLTVPE